MEKYSLKLKYRADELGKKWLLDMKSYLESAGFGVTHYFPVNDRFENGVYEYLYISDVRKFMEKYFLDPEFKERITEEWWWNRPGFDEEYSLGSLTDPVLEGKGYTMKIEQLVTPSKTLCRVSIGTGVKLSITLDKMKELGDSWPAGLEIETEDLCYKRPIEDFYLRATDDYSILEWSDRWLGFWMPDEEEDYDDEDEDYEEEADDSEEEEWFCALENLTALDILYRSDMVPEKYQAEVKDLIEGGFYDYKKKYDR
jgi:hypothetical protein